LLKDKKATKKKSKKKDEIWNEKKCKQNMVIDDGLNFNNHQNFVNQTLIIMI
jgi:hypothetical protein